MKRTIVQSVDASQLSRPSSARYQNLIKKLIEIDTELTKGLHPLSASILSVKAVCEFIGEEPELRQAGISISLRRLLGALNDTASGAKPEMLFSGGITGGKKSGRRKGQTDHFLRGALVNALSGLISAGMKNAEAAKFLEAELSKAGALYQGRQITSANLLQWREVTKDSAPAASDEMVQMVNGLRSKPTNKPTLSLEKDLARGMAIIVARYNSR